MHFQSILSRYLLTLSLVLLILCVAAHSTFAALRYVALDGLDDGNDCLDERNPCRTIMYALIGSVADEILISSGTYKACLFIQRNVTIRAHPSSRTPPILTCDGSMFQLYSDAPLTVTFKGLHIMSEKTTIFHHFPGPVEVLLDSCILTVQNFIADGRDTLRLILTNTRGTTGMAFGVRLQSLTITGASHLTGRLFVMDSDSVIISGSSSVEYEQLGTVKRLQILNGASLITRSGALTERLYVDRGATLQSKSPDDHPVISITSEALVHDSTLRGVSLYPESTTTNISVISSTLTGHSSIIAQDCRALQCSQSITVSNNVVKTSTKLVDINIIITSYNLELGHVVRDYSFHVTDNVVYVTEPLLNIHVSTLEEQVKVAHFTVQIERNIVTMQNIASVPEESLFNMELDFSQGTYFESTPFISINENRISNVLMSGPIVSYSHEQKNGRPTVQINTNEFKNCTNSEVQGAGIMSIDVRTPLESVSKVASNQFIGCSVPRGSCGTLHITGTALDGIFHYESHNFAEDNTAQEQCKSSEMICFGVKATDSSVCGAQKRCFDFDQCLCMEGWYGEQCDLRYCPPGEEYNKDTNACQSCEHGYVNSDPNFQCIACSGGSFSMNGITCDICNVGTYSNKNSGATHCLKCPMGMWNDELGATHCKECPEGTWNDGEGERKCQPCPSGTYRDSTGATNASLCLDCPHGTWSSVPGASNCTKCEPGWGYTNCQPILEEETKEKERDEAAIIWAVVGTAVLTTTVIVTLTGALFLSLFCVTTGLAFYFHRKQNHAKNIETGQNSVSSVLVDKIGRSEGPDEQFEYNHSGYEGTVDTSVEMLNALEAASLSTENMGDKKPSGFLSIFGATPSLPFGAYNRVSSTDQISPAPTTSNEVVGSIPRVSRDQRAMRDVPVESGRDNHDLTELGISSHHRKQRQQQEEQRAFMRQMKWNDGIDPTSMPPDNARVESVEVRREKRRRERRHLPLHDIEMTGHDVAREDYTYPYPPEVSSSMVNSQEWNQRRPRPRPPHHQTGLAPIRIYRGMDHTHAGMNQWQHDQLESTMHIQQERAASAGRFFLGGADAEESA